MDLPSKLTPDMIQEALVEMRFDHSELGDLLVGKLASTFQGLGWHPSELPAREIPEAIRRLDPVFRGVATYELKSTKAGEVIRLGPNVISYHVNGGYIGWEAFLPKLVETIQTVLASTSAVPERFGLRYINVPTMDKHGIGSVWDLNMSVRSGGNLPASDLHLAYRIVEAEDLEGLVRVLTPGFVETAPVDVPVVLIDIDIFTPESSAPTDLQGIIDWLERAHMAEKKIFFGLLNDSTIQRLREK